MRDSPKGSDKNGGRPANPVFVAGGISLVALLATFTVTSLSISFVSKSFLFGIILIGFVVSVWLYWSYGGVGSVPAFADESGSDGPFSEQSEEQLKMLEEAAEFFGASLRSKDMFRLITDKLRQLLPFESCVFLILDEENRLTAGYANGVNAAELGKLSMDCDTGLPGKAFTRHAVEVDTWEKSAPAMFPEPAVEGLRSCAAVPLTKGGEVFATMLVLAAAPNAFSESHTVLLEAVGARIAPLLSSSFAFERSISNALTDSLTDLPNERAFHLVLGNQIAEAQRFRSERTLSVAIIDIRDFAGLNKKYGHGVGDGILSFAARIMKRQLRKMDLIARMQSDEFAVIMPTADAEAANRVLERIRKHLLSSSYTLPDDPDHRISIDFGVAMFDRDGESIADLLRNARARMRGSSGRSGSQVLPFPKRSA